MKVEKMLAQAQFASWKAQQTEIRSSRDQIKHLMKEGSKNRSRLSRKFIAEAAITTILTFASISPVHKKIKKYCNIVLKQPDPKKLEKQIQKFYKALAERIVPTAYKAATTLDEGEHSHIQSLQQLWTNLLSNKDQEKGQLDRDADRSSSWEDEMRKNLQQRFISILA